MVETRLLIFVGQDEAEKEKRLEALRHKLLPSGLKDLNYTLLYADDKNVTPAVLGEALACFPAGGARQRLLVVRAAHKLGRAHQTALWNGLKTSAGTMVVLDVDPAQSKGLESFLAEARKAGGQVVRFKDNVVPNAFDLGRAVAARRPQDALKVLSSLLKYRDKAEKILGALFWQWERARTAKQLSDEAYKKGLALILDADKRLKSTSSAYGRETLILEALVVKLSYLPGQ